MISIDRATARKLANGEISTQDLADIFIKTYPAMEIALALAETYEYELDSRPIVISQEEFSRHFRIKGVRPDGTPENRGRK